MKRYIRGGSAPYMGIEKPPMTDAQKAMRKKTKKVNEELAYDMLEQLSPEKKQQLDKFLSRNEALTSTYGCSFGNLRIYKEGWYLTLDGTRSQFSVWYYDNDGELVEGRKPNENKLNFIYEQDLRFNGIDWYQMVNACSDIHAASKVSDWPDRDWWLSIQRTNDPEVDSLLAILEEDVLNDLGVHIIVYRKELDILNDSDETLVSMSEEQYKDNELDMAASCRSPKEFQGKYRNWIEYLLESPQHTKYLNWDANAR